ncbi:MAG: hypothetical protein LBJ25_02905 [Candidatus Margulisbacteria bacterium]|nr:hypothetical protein [Candidatus Margulisiibacteriota bacterium]
MAENIAVKNPADTQRGDNTEKDRQPAELRRGARVNFALAGTIDRVGINGQLFDRPDGGQRGEQRGQKSV